MKETAFIFLFFAFVGTAKSQNSSAVKLYCDKDHSSITYSMNHPLHSWTGESKNVTSIILTDKKKDLIEQVAVVVRIASFDSGNANRDSHAIEATEALKYPDIRFASSSVIQEGNRLTVTGDLEFHGIKRSITFEAEKKAVRNQEEVSGGFQISMTDFKIDPPSLMGIPTDDKIDISFDMVY